MTDRFEVDPDPLSRVAQGLDGLAAGLRSVVAQLGSLEGQIAAAGPLAQRALSQVGDARNQVSRGAWDLDSLRAEVSRRARLLASSQQDAGVGSPGGLLEGLGQLKDQALAGLGQGEEALSAAAGQVLADSGELTDEVLAGLPSLPVAPLDPNGAIARAGQGEAVDPLAWSQEVAGDAAQTLLAEAPAEIREARLTVTLPGLGEQTLTTEALVALALDPANLLGLAPVEGGTAAVLEQALAYLKGPARAAAVRLLEGVAPDLAQQVIAKARLAASRTGLSEQVMRRSLLRTAESAQAAADVGGFIDYGGIDELGRPTGIRATITEGMTARGFGTKANADLIPPGYVVQDPPFARGHLLGRQLGGSGDVYENLVTLYQNDVNTPLMSDIERQVKLAVQSGQRVEYEVTPIYQGSQGMPARLRLRARGQRVSGTGDVLDLDVTIENVPRSLPKLDPPPDATPATSPP